MFLAVKTKPVGNTVAGVLYAYSGRKFGWYCYAHNAAGDQIGDAEYDWNMQTRGEILTEKSIKRG